MNEVRVQLDPISVRLEAVLTGQTPHDDLCEGLEAIADAADQMAAAHRSGALYRHEGSLGRLVSGLLFAGPMIIRFHVGGPDPARTDAILVGHLVLMLDQPGVIIREYLRTGVFEEYRAGLSRLIGALAGPHVSSVGGGGLETASRPLH